jgi:copper transport protein
LVAVEAAVAVVILALTSVLVQLTPGRTAAEDGTGRPGVQTAVVSDPGNRFVLTADLLPARTGINQLHLYAATPDGRPMTVVEWSVRASNAGAGIEDVDAIVYRVTDDHASGQITLPASGDWRFVFTLRLDEITNGIVAATFTVR